MAALAEGQPPKLRLAEVQNLAPERYRADLTLDPDKTEIRFNSEWFDGMTFPDVIRLCGKYTVARLLERDDFAKRFRENVASARVGGLNLGKGPIFTEDGKRF